MYICALHACRACRCHQGPEEDVGFPGTGGVSCHVGYRQVRAIMCILGTKLGPLSEQQVPTSAKLLTYLSI